MFLVIDGSSVLSTQYYGNLPKALLFEKDPKKKEALYGKILQVNGVYTNAVYGMLRFILNTIRDQKPDYLAVVFDQTRNTFRKAEYSEYKANRSETPSPLKQQYETMALILKRLGIITLSHPDYEADDLAGSIIRKYEGTEMPVRFITKDHDYLQLVSDYTRGWMLQISEDNVRALHKKYNTLLTEGVDMDSLLPSKVFEFTRDVVYGEEGVYPEQIPDKKGICGDSSDNIPGIKGVGESSVIPLLGEYKTVEGIYDEIRALSEPEKKELNLFWKESLGIKRSPMKQLLDGEEDALLSKRLATIKTDVDLKDGDTPETYRYDIDMNTLDQILDEYQFKSLKEAYHESDFRRYH